MFCNRTARDIWRFFYCLASRENFVFVAYSCLWQDILDLLRGLPVVDGRIDRFKAVEAYDVVSKICDDCRQQDHDEFCAINITLTALGTLVYGPTFKTEKDKQIAM
ncbi:hypothetical protein [Sporomusa sp.]|uniref:hypothetical protein n=1 Tax=Sporomusa sp. TaxID=2078658 RepID=UPI002D0AD99D|nr:hypothetical protein [Sporomusa sp.]HWR44425.1 hypothetical protein [Sporomusa sp.]